MNEKPYGFQPENRTQEDRTQEEKRIDLYLRQKKLLDIFLANGAISQAQYDKSFGDLTVKMGMQDYAGTESIKEKQQC